MNLLVAGSRSYRFCSSDYARLELLHRKHKIQAVIVGDMFGACEHAARWAKEKFLDVISIRAGELFSHRLMTHATAIALFPGGHNTEALAQLATKNGLTIYDWREDS